MVPTATGAPLVNQDLEAERRNATFDKNILTTLIDGGHEGTKTRKHLENVLFSDPLFCKETYFQSRSERYDSGVEKAVRIIEMAKKHNWNYNDTCWAVIYTSHEPAIWLHLQMFIPTLEKLTTEEQKSKWLPLAKEFKILGTYAQTELGHGTNLQALETTAVYDKTTQEFILDTPSLTAMKWWPGALAKTSTHCIVLAHLFIDGQKCGMQGFLVQLRSLEDHHLLPGISTGDIAPKLELGNLDNGFLILDHVRIPRINMLMKFYEVTPEGKFKKKSSSKANYAVMTDVRIDFVIQSFNALMVVTTVAIRYSAVRRQSSMKPGSPEVQILDFQTQQYKLFPIIAQAYAFHFNKLALQHMSQEIQEEISRGEFKNLAVLHLQSSCLKAFCTDATAADMEVCRRSCGGHGYLLSAGFGPKTNKFVSSVTVEGENTVLYLQSAKILLKSCMSAMQGNNLPPVLQYLMSDTLCSINIPEDLMQHRHLLSLYQHRAKRLVIQASMKFQSLMEREYEQYTAWNNCSQEFVVAARAHAHMTVVTAFVEGITTVKDSNARKVLDTLCSLYLLHGIVIHSGEFLKTGAITVEQLDMIQRQELELLAIIRPDALALVEAFDLHDMVLTSTLGCYDGNVYQRLYASTKKNPMNDKEVPDCYYKYLRPLITGQKSKL